MHNVLVLELGRQVTRSTILAGSGLVTGLCDRPFGRKHSPVADHRQNNLAIQCRDTQSPGRVTGSKASGSGRVRGSDPVPSLQHIYTLWTACSQREPGLQPSRSYTFLLAVNTETVLLLGTPFLNLGCNAPGHNALYRMPPGQNAPRNVSTHTLVYIYPLTLFHQLWPLEDFSCLRL